jgi:hypothetical protein
MRQITERKKMVYNTQILDLILENALCGTLKELWLATYGSIEFSQSHSSIAELHNRYTLSVSANLGEEKAENTYVRKSIGKIKCI